MNLKKVWTIAMLLMTVYTAQSQITLTRQEAEQVDLRLQICKELEEFNDSLQSIVIVYQNSFDLLADRIDNLEKLNFKLQTNWQRLQPEVKTLQDQNKQLTNDVGWYKQERDKLAINQKKLKRRTWYITGGAILTGVVAGILVSK